MLEEKRDKFRFLEILIGKILSKLDLHPNYYTFLSLICGTLCFYFLLVKNLMLAFLFFFFATILDFIDGAISRYMLKSSKKGAYLDTIVDRYVEGMVLFGFLSLPLSKVLFDAKYWIFLSLFGSLITTYAKAAAKEKELVEKEMKKGLVGKGERSILILITLFVGIFNIELMIYPILLFALLSNFGAIQRIVFNLK